jgi:hypothetical protein
VLRASDRSRDCSARDAMGRNCAAKGYHPATVDIHPRLDLHR